MTISYLPPEGEVIYADAASFILSEDKTKIGVDTILDGKIYRAVININEFYTAISCIFNILGENKCQNTH
jgi:hypothetical protein